MARPKPKAVPADLRSSELLTPLNYASILRFANVEDEARRLAIRGEPKAGDQALTPCEANIIEMIEARSIARAEQLGAARTAIAEELIPLEGAPPTSDPRILERQVLEETAQLFTSRGPAIVKTAEAARTEQATLNAWRSRNKVARPAHYPASRLYHFRGLPAAIGLEAVLTAAMYLPATPNGLAGAALLGGSIAVVTTGLGLALGIGPLRYLGATSPWQRTGAAIATPLLIALIVLVAGYTAHWRQVADTLGDAPAERAVMQHLIDAPLDISLPGIMLLLLTLAAAAFATFKGYTASDPIPGYEAVDSAAEAARADLNYLRSDIRAGIAAIKGGTINPLLDAPLIARLRADHHRTQLIALDTHAERLAEIDTAEAANAERAIQRFRQLNRKTRTDGIVPAYFAEPVIIAATERRPTTALAQRIDAVHTAAAAAAEREVECALQLGRLIDQIADHTDTIMGQLEHSLITPDATKADPDSTLRTTLETITGVLPCPALSTSTPIAGTPSSSSPAQVS